MTLSIHKQYLEISRTHQNSRSKLRTCKRLDLFLKTYLHWWCNVNKTKTILMNKVISHIYYLYIASPLVKKRFGYKLFAINFYFSSSQYYRTLDKTLAIKLSLHLICFIIRLYSCNRNSLSVIFILHLLYVTVLWSVNTTIGWNVHQNASKITIRQVIFFNCGKFFVIFVKRLRKIAIRQI